MKRRVTVSVERLNYDPVKKACDSLGRDFSSFVNALCGMLAGELEFVSPDDIVEVKRVVDRFLNRQRG